MEHTESKQELQGLQKNKIVLVQAEIYSRVSGYYRPVSQWNAGKREEYFDRKKIKQEGLIEGSVNNGGSIQPDHVAERAQRQEKNGEGFQKIL